MGRHAIAGRGPRARIAIAAVAVLALGGAGWVAADRIACADPTAVRIVAAPDIAPFVDQVARGLGGGGLGDGAACAAVTVDARSSATAAESLALSDGSDRPHIWVPESSALLARAIELGAADVPAAGEPIASSPVVMAMADDTAGRLGWPADRPDWVDVLDAPDVTIGLPDPTRDPVGLAALLEMQAMTRAGPEPDATFTATLRRLAAQTTVDSADLFSRLPGTPGTTEPVTAFPATEQALLRHNVVRPEEPLTAAYSDRAATDLDYPFTVLDSAGEAEREVARRLLEALRAPDGQSALAEGGFRTTAGQMLRDRSADGRTSAVAPLIRPLSGSPDAAAVLTGWATVNRSARVQVLIDVSGSMNAVVPELGGTRMQATLQAAEQGLSLFQPTTRLGYWTFSTKLDGDKDYREVIPVGAVRDLLGEPAIGTLRSIAAVPDGATGLFDSVLAAYRDSQQNWEPGRFNLVIVMTDGNNDDADGISRDELLAELARSADPQRPVVVIGVAIGPDIDPAELQAITAPTGGRAFVAADPSRISEVFFGALASLQSP